jgi:hypothetical protein
VPSTLPLIYPKLRDIDCVDVEDLTTYDPGDDFFVAVQLSIGPHNGEGAEQFQLVICSPLGLENRMAIEDIRLGEHMIICRRFNYRRIVGFIERFCAHCSGNSWDEVAQKLSHLGSWEFADYTPSL